jgi:Spy/CpxP family protein refolding chaperone
MAAGGKRYLIMKRIKPWLVLALVFLAGLVLGVVATRIAVRKFVQTAITQPDKLRDRIELRMSRRLALTPEQREKVHATLQQTQERIQALRAETQPHFNLILTDARDEIAAVLTPEQRERFAAFRRENQQLFPGLKLD